jgi:hypothetical protein
MRALADAKQQQVVDADVIEKLKATIHHSERKF